MFGTPKEIAEVQELENEIAMRFYSLLRRDDLKAFFDQMNGINTSIQKVIWKGCFDQGHDKEMMLAIIQNVFH